MQPRETRFWLRFESGERSGETVPLPDGVATLGRRTGSQVLVPDTSVSGRHAEVRIGPEGAAIHDLGSKNGTRVGGTKVEEQRLAHGDRISIGNVQLVFLDRTLDQAPAKPAPLAEPAEKPGEMRRVSQERVTSAGRRSFAGVLLLAAAVLAGGFLAWRTFLGGEAEVDDAPVTPVPGNRLADASFEEGALAWEAAEAAPQSFGLGRAFARRGSSGLGVELEAGGWALAFSPAFDIGAREALDVRAALSVEEGAEGRLGVELSSSQGAASPWIAWARSSTGTSGFEEVALALGSIPGFDRGRMVVAAVAAQGPGRVALDDVAVVPDPAGAPEGASFQEFQALTFGPQGSSAAVVRSGRVVLPGIDLGAWGPLGISGWGGAGWEAEAGAKGLFFRAPGAPADSVLHLRFDIAPAGGDSEGWIATIGPTGFRAQAAQFEVDEATSLLGGRGLDLMRVGFARPVKLVGNVADGALRVRAELGDQGGFELQVTFTEERAAAAQLAERAVEAERKGDAGAALAAWNELFDRYPFDSATMAKAAESRARLISSGLEEVEEVRRELERARFFQLPDLYLDCRRHLEETARRYAGGEVAVEAEATIAALADELALLEGGAEGGELARVRAVLDALDPEKSPKLAQHVRAYVEQHADEHNADEKD